MNVDKFEKAVFNKDQPNQFRAISKSNTYLINNKKTSIMKKLPLAILLGSVLLFSSCKSGGNQTPENEVVEVETTQSIIGQKWQLVELNGKAVDETVNGKQPFIQFQEDSRYTANAGCNSLAGGFELNEDNLRIKFSQGISTMMACENMELEQELSRVLETVDNFTQNEGVLSLNKARMAPLAVFKAVTE